MALTSDQLADFQADIGISDDESVFTDAELDRLYERAGSDYPTAIYYAWRQLLAAASKYIDYRVAQTDEKRSQIYQHIREMVAHWQLESQKSTNVQGVRSIGLLEIPPRDKDAPLESELDRARRRVLR